MQLVWHRQDLRGEDNTALSEAGAASAEYGNIIGVFVVDERLLDPNATARCHFVIKAVENLRAWYRDSGGELLIERGDPRKVLPTVAEEQSVTIVRWNADYTRTATQRDNAVAAALDDRGIEVERHHDAYHHEPGSITTTNGDAYSRFQYFGKKWLDRPKAPPQSPPAERCLATVDSEPAPTPADLGLADPTITIPEASTMAARDRLSMFLDGQIFRYAEAREYPGKSGTSRLSPHLTHGTIGIREVYAGTERAERKLESATVSEETALEGITEFRRQLAWREFYAQVLAANPSIVSENFTDFEQPIDWREDHQDLAAWKAGETGYPLVDAGMRQLNTEGWMHNRVRMVVASFLTKDLLIDWRTGYRWFRRHLIDHDTANDVGGWQWAASTGADAQPYFRIFNPSTQCERFDPDGSYVREYVPELTDVPTDLIHEWPTVSAEKRDAFGTTYPDPIVDHDTARERAIEAFERARGDA